MKIDKVNYIQKSKQIQNAKLENISIKTFHFENYCKINAKNQRSVQRSSKNINLVTFAGQNRCDEPAGTEEAG